MNAKSVRSFKKKNINNHVLKKKRAINLFTSVFIALILFVSPVFSFDTEADSYSVTITDNSEWQLKGDESSRWVENTRTGEYLSNGWYLVDFGTQLLQVDSKGEYYWHGYTSKAQTDYYKCSPININVTDYSYKYDQNTNKLKYISTGVNLASGWYNVKDIHWWYFDADGYACMDNFTNGYPNGVFDDYYFGCYSWHLDSNGWYYVNESGDYVKNAVVMIDGAWYLFDKDGYLGDANTWYDLGYSYASGDKWVSEWWYVGSTEGMPCIGWGQADGNWYYWDASPQGTKMMATDRWKDGWYLDKDGIGHSGSWYEDSTGWYYMADNGAYVTSYIELDGIRYYFNSQGYWTGQSEAY